jgi:hypothetical protein
MKTCSRCIIMKDESEFLSRRGKELKQCSLCRKKNLEWAKNKPTDKPEPPSQKMCPVCKEEKPRECFLTPKNRPTKRCYDCIEKSKIMQK